MVFNTVIQAVFICTGMCILSQYIDGRGPLLKEPLCICGSKCLWPWVGVDCDVCFYGSGCVCSWFWIWGDIWRVCVCVSDCVWECLCRWMFASWCFLSQDTCTCGWLCSGFKLGVRGCFPPLDWCQWSPLPLPSQLGSALHSGQTRQSSEAPPSHLRVLAHLCSSIHELTSGLGCPTPQLLARPSRAIQLQEWLGPHQSQELFSFF